MSTTEQQAIEAGVPRLELVVSAGPDLGARVALGEDVVSVGRDRDADLRLTDLTVSRRHLEVAICGEEIEVRTVGAVAPFQVDDERCELARVAVGSRFVVGNTVLTAVPVRAASGIDRMATREVTDVRTLLGDRSTAVSSLSAIFTLSEKLDAAVDEEQLMAVLADWVREQLGAGSKVLVQRSPDSADGDEQFVETVGQTAGCVQLSVPLVGLAHANLQFELDQSERSMSDELRRMLVVAGRVVASSLVRQEQLQEAQRENDELRTLALGSARSFLGSTPHAERIEKMLDRLAQSNAVALLRGETGAGKSFLARLIHENGPRAGKPFRVINCAAIPENLVEAELFGYEKGAFTGAAGAKQGALEAAGDGTVLLDEIGDLPLNSQAKLLHVLEEKTFERLGSNASITLDARVLTATNRDLKQMTSDGTFRSDLYYRVSVITVPVPSLRERSDDIPVLAERFLNDLAGSAGRRVTGFSAATLEAFRNYAWPGNVRELRNVIEHALVLGDGPIIEPSDLPRELVQAAAVHGEQSGEAESDGGGDEGLGDLPLNLGALEVRAIRAALTAAGGNRTKAASLLGINRVTLYKKLRAMDAEPDEPLSDSGGSDGETGDA